MKKVLAFLLAAIMVLGLVGCVTTTTTTPTVTTTTPITTSPTLQPVSFRVLKSDVSYITTPDVTNSQLATLVSGNSSFAFNLYQQLKKNNTGNLFYSPYSISTALAMTYAGAAGDTEKQMSSALHFTLPQAQ